MNDLYLMVEISCFLLFFILIVIVKELAKEIKTGTLPRLPNHCWTDTGRSRSMIRLIQNQPIPTLERNHISNCSL